MLSARPSQVRQRDRRDPGGVARGARAWSPAARRPAGEEHLVEVGHLEAAAEDLPGAAGAERRRARRVASVGQRRSGRSDDRGPLGRQVRAPEPVGIGLAPRRWSGRSAPSADGPPGPSRRPRARRACAAAATAPCRRSPVVAAHQHQPAAQLLRRAPRRAARRPRPRRGSSVLCGSQVPMSHTMTSPAAVLPGRDDALEVEVLDRVVLDVHAPAAAPPGPASVPSGPPS